MTEGRLVKLGTGESFTLGFEPLTIGRHEDNSIILADQQASRHHAEVLMQGGQWVIHDLDSANGTYVNGERVEQSRTLHQGDTIQIGQTLFQIEILLGIGERATLVERRPAFAVQEPATSSARWRKVAWGVALLTSIAAITILALIFWAQGQQRRATEQAAATWQAAATNVVQATETAASEAAGATQHVSPGSTDAPLTLTEEPIEPTAEPEPPVTPTILPTKTPYPAPVIGFFDARSPGIGPGGCTRLRWGQIEHAAQVELLGVGRVNAEGKLDVCPDASRVYTLQATGPGGTSSAQLSVALVIPPVPVIEYFRAIPSIVAPGSCAQLEWGSVDNAESAEIEPDIGGVATPGTVEVCPAGTTTYFLTARNKAGSVVAETTLIVSSDTASKPVISYFTANPAKIQAGECTLLDWGKVDYATEVIIDQGIGGVATPNSEEVCLGATTTFVMTASGPGGITTNELQVDVSPGALAELPDLVIESILFEPNPCYRGIPCKIRIKVRNDGPQNADRFVVRWAPEGQNAVPVEWDVDALGAGLDKTLTYNWIPNQARENWLTVATVDAYQDIMEIGEEESNVAQQVITVLTR